MRGMLCYAAVFNGEISHWNVSSVTDTNMMFSYAKSFDGDVSKWDVSSVTDMRRMFSSAASCNGDLSTYTAYFGVGHCLMATS